MILAKFHHVELRPPPMDHTLFRRSLLVLMCCAPTHGLFDQVKLSYPWGTPGLGLP